MRLVTGRKRNDGVPWPHTRENSLGNGRANHPATNIKKSMAKVLLNTANRLSVMSNDMRYILRFDKAYNTGVSEATGKPYYEYLGWRVKAYAWSKQWNKWQPTDSSHIPQMYKNKAAVLEFLTGRPTFSMAAEEITQKMATKKRKEVATV